MSQKTGFTSFQFAIWIFLFVWLVAIILQGVVGAGFIVWLPLLFAFGYAIALRLHIVRRYNITECGDNCFGCIGEFCCGFWCWYCSVVQSKITMKVFQIKLIFIRLTVSNLYVFKSAKNCSCRYAFYTYLYNYILTNT